jgi:hypothetical protein
MDNYLRWNGVNWLTVVLMVTIAYVAFGLVSKLVKNAASGTMGGG